jgi:hypothetical protein
MATFKHRLFERNRQIIDQAKRRCKRKENDAFSESDLQREVASIIRADLDLDTEAYRRAAKIIEQETKQIGEDDEDDDNPAQLKLSIAGEKYSYDPERLVKNNTGDIIEWDRAPLSFLMADLSRSSVNLSRVTKWNNRKVQQVTLFQTWIEEQRAKGRKEVELTWGNCVRATGMLDAGKAASTTAS